jgi:hypothetical protein
MGVKQTIWAILMCVLAVPAHGAEFDHSLLDKVLKQYVNEQSRVDYAALKAQPQELNEYVSLLGARSPVSHAADFPSRESRLAYWINAYNAFVLKGVIDRWPVGSVRDIGAIYGFFWRTKFVAGGASYTLNQIENRFLRDELKEPRIHFAIVCASNSCPRLSRDAYTAENTESQLAESTRFYFSEDRNLKIDAQRNRVWLSRIMSFYRKDYEDWARQKKPGTAQPLLEYVIAHTTEEKGKMLAALKNPKISFYHYDWGINDVNAPNPSPKYGKKESEP